MISKETAASWGGPWTEKKLIAFQNYVIAYLTIMNKNPYWETIYFDGFAGSGERGEIENPLYLKLELDEVEEKVYQGAVERLAKLIAPHRFNYYYFIEKDNSAAQALKTRTEGLHGNQPGKRIYRIGDCNEQLQLLANTLKKTKTPSSTAKKYAALIFLDPFGMQIRWQSIADLANTRSDIWILLPTAVIVNRLLDKKGELKSAKLLEHFFGIGEEEIRKHFYVPTGQHALFDNSNTHYAKVSDPITKIAELYIKNLGSIWKHVSKRPLRLNNTKGAPLFHFVFASNNPNAMKIADDIIKNI
jgi:three-Cys-motif partner protein